MKCLKDLKKDQITSNGYSRETAFQQTMLSNSFAFAGSLVG